MQPLSTHSDEQLLRLVRENDDEAAFTEIYHRYRKTLHSSAHNILQVKDAAQDAVQEVFISLWKRRGLVHIESLKSYLLQSVRFQVLKMIRAEKADAGFIKRLSQASKDILREDPLLFRELDSLLTDVIRSLPEDQQAIFAMSREKEMTYKEIAAEKGISVKTVEKKMSQALRHIRLNLDDALILLVGTHFLS